MTKSESDGAVMVRTNRGEIPFSVGYLAKALLALGISEDQAQHDSRKIAGIVNSLNIKLFQSWEIMDITEDWYEKNHPELASRVKIIKDDFDKLRPMVILLGGVTGIGKSTLAQLVASRLDIRSIMGTDLIREVMRVTVSDDLIPTLHVSSYLAHSKLDTSFLPALSRHIVGFEQQARSVSVGVEATIEQAIDNDEILLIEGVHLVPGLLKKKYQKDPRIIHIQLVLSSKKTHKSRLKQREKQHDHRGTTYSKYFKEIREIQDYLIQQAENNKITIIDVKSEDALLEILNTIWIRVEQLNYFNEVEVPD
jgi:2-phosphoglycerate kinase